MSLDVDIYQALKAAGVTPLKRGFLPESTALPCVVVRYVSDRPQKKLNGMHTRTNERIVVDVWASKLREAESKRDQIKAALDERRDTHRINCLPFHEPKKKEFRFTLEYSVWG